MKLMTKPQSVNGVRKKTRMILEKLKDLSSQRKFQNLIHKNKIARKNGNVADVQVCIIYLLESYSCFLAEQCQMTNYPRRKYEILSNNLKTLNIKVDESVKNTNPISIRYISNVLKAQTIFFNSLKSKQLNHDCSDLYEKFVLSAISVWNNDWR